MYIITFIFFQLVCGEFDLESNFVIEEPENINYLLELLDHCSVTLQVILLTIYVTQYNKRDIMSARFILR